MWKNTFFLLASFNLLACTIASSQHSTSGYVLDGSSKAPLEGVSVYYDGTSIGTITDENGYFEIGVKETISASLVIGYIGFENRIFSHNEKGFLGNILLSEKAVQLNEVVLKPDTWNREKKLLIVWLFSSYKFLMRHIGRACGENIFSLEVCRLSFCS